VEQYRDDMSTPTPPPPPAGAPLSSTYPVTFAFDAPERIARWRPLVHWLLAIPHMIILYALGIVSGIVVFISWFAGVITGRIPEGLQSVVVMTSRYSARLSTYLMFLRAEYPPFAFSTEFADPGTDRVRFDVVPQIEGRSRLTIFFRGILLIPLMIVGFFLAIALYVVMIIAFFAVLILGRWPSGLRDFAVGFTRWQTRVNAYANLLTDDYPPFGLS